jgi:hypothetical protein
MTGRHTGPPSSDHNAFTMTTGPQCKGDDEMKNQRGKRTRDKTVTDRSARAPSAQEQLDQSLNKLILNDEWDQSWDDDPDLGGMDFHTVDD